MSDDRRWTIRVCPVVGCGSMTHTVCPVHRRSTVAVEVMPVSPVVPLALLREWIESQHLITRVADRLVAGSPMRAASNARGELLDSLSRLLAEFERTTNHNEGTL